MLTNIIKNYYIVRYRIMKNYTIFRRKVSHVILLYYVTS